MGPVSIGVEVQRNTDGDTPSIIRPTFNSLEHLLFMSNGSVGPLKRYALCSLIINSFLVM